VKRKYRILSSSGIDEKLYININGHNQYVFIRGKDINNPIILNIHGGPANPDAFLTYEFAQAITDEFTYISWDQRGCGRTYYKNKHIDPKNESTDFVQAIRDVDELVNYLCKRFKKKKIVIMGHSYGSLLGASYVAKYPERVERYIGIGQSISIKDTQKMNYNEAACLLKDNRAKSDKLAMAYKGLQESFSPENLMKFQRITLPCFVANMPDLKRTNQIKLILSSPDLAFNDIRWLVGMLNLKAHYTRNKKLLDYTLSANIYHIGNEYSVPMYFISGEYDKTCRVDLLKKYYDGIIAPNKKLVIMKACGHSPQIDEPMLFAEEVKKLLQN